MGDRCLVDLTVLTVHLPQVLKILGSETPDTETVEDDCTVLSFEEVNYGNLPVVDELTAAGIAWDTRIHGGDEYGPSQKYLRFAPDGTIQINDFTDAEEGNIPSAALLEYCNLPGVTVDKIRAYIVDHMRSLDPLPWEDQVEFGKRYLALKLIGGT
jgi:hypothetical protein